MADDKRQQKELPFGEAEGSFAERKELLGLALQKENASLYEAQFMLWLFNVTDGGVRGWLEKSYAELACRPWGLCCHPNQAAATARRCAARGWVDVAATLVRQGMQGSNRYSLNWEGIRRTLFVQLRPHTTCDPPHTPCEGPHTTCDPIGITPSEHGSSEPNPNRSRPEKFFEEIPELAEARSRTVAPLNCGTLAYGAFAPLKELDTLRDGSLVSWFRRQLGLPRPLTGDSEAELLLVLAAGLAAHAMRQSDVQKNRFAVFSATVSKAKWRRVLPFVPEARKLLDELCERYPELLTNAVGIGPKACPT